MEWIVGFLVGAVAVLVWRAVEQWKALDKLQSELDHHKSSYRHECHPELPSYLGGKPLGERVMGLTYDQWGDIWKAIRSKQDAPLLRRSTDVKHNRRKGDKK